MGSRASGASILQPGTQAPDFHLDRSANDSMSLSDLRGHPAILVFYPADWSPVCGDQLALYNQILPEFKQFDTNLVGISVDGVWCHGAFADARNLHFPLLSDFEPKGAVARAYGAYLPDDGTAARALYVLDAEGVVRWSYLSPLNINPGADGILSALEEMPAQARHR
jgi:peroxiredoxin